MTETEPMRESQPMEVRPFSFFISVSGYPIRVLVAVGLTRPQIEKKLAPYGCSNDTCMREWAWREATTEVGRATILPCNQTVLWFRNSQIDSVKYGSIAHEVFHLIYGALDNLGLRLTADSEEAYAYAIQHLAVRVIDGLMAHRKPRRAIIPADGANRSTVPARRAAVRPRPRRSRRKSR